MGPPLAREKGLRNRYFQILLPKKIDEKSMLKNYQPGCLFGVPAANMLGGAIMPPPPTLIGLNVLIFARIKFRANSRRGAKVRKN